MKFVQIQSIVSEEQFSEGKVDGPMANAQDTTP